MQALEIALATTDFDYSLPEDGTILSRRRDAFHPAIIDPCQTRQNLRRKGSRHVAAVHCVGLRDARAEEFRFKGRNVSEVLQQLEDEGLRFSLQQRPRPGSFQGGVEPRTRIDWESRGKFSPSTDWGFDPWSRCCSSWCAGGMTPATLSGNVVDAKTGVALSAHAWSCSRWGSLVVGRVRAVFFRCAGDG